MKQADKGVGAIELLATLGFIALCILMITRPSDLDTNIMIGILSGLLGLKTIGRLVMDSHNKIHYQHSQKGGKSEDSCCGGGCC